MSKVFISYAHGDIRFVKKLSQRLEECGLEVWRDTLKIRGGDRFMHEIESALKLSEYVIVVLSNESIKSEWVEKEYSFALTLRMKIIPILLETCKIPIALSNIQYIDGSHKKINDVVLNLMTSFFKDKYPSQINAPKQNRWKKLLQFLPLNLKKSLGKYWLSILGGCVIIITMIIAMKVLVPKSRPTATPTNTLTPTATPTLTLAVTPTPTGWPLGTLTSTDPKPACAITVSDFNEPGREYVKSLQYTVTSKGGYCSWIIPLNGYNATSNKQITFWVRGDKGEQFEVGIKDTKTISGLEPKVSETASASWTEISIPLERFKRQDLSSLEYFSINFTVGSGTVYVDQLIFVP